MKNYIILGISLILALGLFSCCKKEEVKPKSTFTADLNGKSWTGEVQAVLTGEKELNFGTIVRENNFEREILSFRKIVLTTGKIPLLSVYTDSITHITYGTSYSTSQDDGDVGCDLYQLYTPDSLVNYIDIQVYDADKRYIEGEYSGTYLRDKTNGVCDPSKPDTMRFRNGRFGIYY